jgi:hypothetical protein
MVGNLEPLPPALAQHLQELLNHQLDTLYRLLTATVPKESEKEP